MVLPSEIEGAPERKEAALERLHHWLTLEGSTAVLIPSLFFFPGAPTLLKWAAIAFTPYMLWRLYQLRRFGWIAAFVVGVVLPFVLIPTPQNFAYAYVLRLLPLFLFYTYTWILRAAVSQWLLDERTWPEG